MIPSPSWIARAASRKPAERQTQVRSAPGENPAFRAEQVQHVERLKPELPA